jgi:ATP-dependent RNA helicase SUPV3L1/SUV3
MVEEGPSRAESDQPAAESQPRHDFSVVQGFQVVGAEDHRSNDETWRDALRLELEARAERLRQAVDAAFVLSNDGIIRWLGDPVGRLSPGPDALNASTLIFADESLPDEFRTTIKTRIELWIAATTRRLFAPLLELDGLQEGSEIVRDLARELVRSLGVLEREPIKAKIRTLTQEDRAELRKHGVRFGAYYLFLPTLLKPAARALALQLWALQKSGDASELLRTLGPVASSGRTSLPVDKEVAKDGYRVAGYRACGERIVRVDVVERLAGMIRSAIAGETPGGGESVPTHRPSKGFVINGSMTSLTGCSGEPFASILRSMGFRPVEMKRSEFFGTQSAAVAVQQGEALQIPDSGQPTEDGETSPPPFGEDAVEAATVLAEPLTEAASDTAEVLEVQAEGSDLVSEAADAVTESEDQTSEDAEGTVENDEAVSAGGMDATSQDDSVVAEGVDRPAVNADGVDNMLDHPVVASNPSGGGEIAEGGGQAELAQTPTSEGTKDTEIIIVWRPDHRRSPPRREMEAKRPRSEQHRRSDAPQPQAGPANWRREETPRPTKRPNPRNFANADEKRRQRPKDYDMARATPPTAPQQKAKVDPNSPFAKLLELRSLLEEQANKRH